MGPPSLSPSPYIGEISCIIFSLRDYIVRVFCLQREKSQGRAPPSKVRHSGGETDKEEEEEEKDSVRLSFGSKRRRSPNSKFALFFLRGGTRNDTGRARAQSRRQTRSSSSDAAQTRAPCRELCRRGGRRVSQSVRRSRAEGEDSLAQVKSRLSSCRRFCQEKGRTVSRKTELPPPRDSARSRPTPSPRIYIFGDRRVGCALLQRVLFGVRDAALSRGGAGEEESSHLSCQVHCLGRVCRRIK